MCLCMLSRLPFPSFRDVSQGYVCLCITYNSNIKLCLYFSLLKSLVFSEALVKKKWKYLRGQYSVELRKLPPARSGDTQTSKWQYFHLLHFLKDVVKPRASTGNFSSVLASDAVGTSLPGSPQLGYQIGDMETPFVSEESMPASSLHTKKKASKRLKTEDYNQSFLDIKRQKIKYLMEKSSHKQDKDDDEDLMFFKSLLPHVQKISVAQKLKLRGRIQETVRHFAYQVPITFSPPHTYESSNPASVSTPQVSPHSYTHSP